MGASKNNGTFDKQGSQSQDNQLLNWDQSLEKSQQLFQGDELRKDENDPIGHFKDSAS